MALATKQRKSIRSGRVWEIRPDRFGALLSEPLIALVSVMGCDFGGDALG